MPDTNDTSVAKPRDPGRPTPTGLPLAEQVKSLRLPKHEPTRAGSSWFAWLVALVAIGGCVWFYWQWRAATRALASAVENAGSLAAGPVNGASGGNVRTTPTASAGEIALEYSGYVTPAHQILVSPQVSGRLLKLNIEEGRRVIKGEVLAEIDRTEYQADLARAHATLALNSQRLLELERGNRPEEIEQARAELAEWVAQVGQLEAEYNRSAQLVKNLLIPPQDFEITESKFRAMERRVERMRYSLKLMEDGPRQERIDSAKAEVDQARAEVMKARWKLDNCTIAAPISGTILKKNAEEGNIVNPVAFNGSFSVCELADLSDLEVSVDIQERDIANVFQGQSCRIRASEAYPDRSYSGIVSRLMPIADRAKGAIQVRVKLRIPPEEEGVYLKPEMSAKVSFLAARPAPVESPDVVPDASGIGLPNATSGSTSTPDPPGVPTAPDASAPSAAPAKPSSPRDSPPVPSDKPEFPAEATPVDPPG